MFPVETVRIVVLLAIFVAVFLLAQVFVRFAVEGQAHSGAVNRRLKMISRGADREEVMAMLRRHDPNAIDTERGPLSSLYAGFRRNLMMAAVPLQATQVAVFMIVLFAILALGISLAIYSSSYAFTAGIVQIVLVFSAAVAVGLPVLAISFLAQRRRKKMQAQFPVALDIFVRALRSGHPIASAIDLLTHEMEDPLGSEFGLVSDEVSYGANLTEALEDLGERWDLDDIRMFVVSLSVQSETGGNLAEILQNLSKVIRERAGLYLKVRALSSEGRMTGWLLSALPVITFVALFSMNPGFYLDVATDPIFYIGFPLLLVWYLIGVYAIRRMIDLKV